LYVSKTRKNATGAYLTIHTLSRYAPPVDVIHGISEPGWIYRAGAKLQSMISYVWLKKEYGSRCAPAWVGAGSGWTNDELNRRMGGYPRNHHYRIVGGRIVPGFRVNERLRVVMAQYPTPMHSFLDIGCCRGFYVLDAAVRLGCPRAVGIDVHEPFVATARDAAQSLSVANAAFHHTSLEQVSADLQKFGGPFQTVLLIGTYHYLYWGSSICGTAYHSHEEILGRLAALCTDRLLISGRFTMRRLPLNITDTFRKGQDGSRYTTEAFLQAAARFFHVRHAGYLGVYPLFVMTKKDG
jgi:hypothetical protein